MTTNPKKSPTTLSIRLTPEDFMTLMEAAAREKVTVGKLAKAAVVKLAASHEHRSPDPVKDMQDQLARISRQLAAYASNKTLTPTTAMTPTTSTAGVFDALFQLPETEMMAAYRALPMDVRKAAYRKLSEDALLRFERIARDQADIDQQAETPSFEPADAPYAIPYIDTDQDALQAEFERLNELG